MFWIRSTPHYESWIRPWYYRYSFFFNFPAHSIFTFDEFWGSLGTSIFRKSSLAANNIRSTYLPGYLFNSYDYGYTLPLAFWYETNAAQRMVVKSDLSLHTRHGFWYFWFQTSALRTLWSNFKFSLLLYFDMTLQLLYVKVELFSTQLLFYVNLVKWECWFSILFVSYQPKYTQIDLTRQLISTHLVPVWRQFSFFFLYVFIMLHEYMRCPKFSSIQ